MIGVLGERCEGRTKLYEGNSCCCCDENEGQARESFILWRGRSEAACPDYREELSVPP